MRKNTKGKRFLALVLAAVLMLSVCPVTASAEDTTEATQPPETTVATEPLGTTAATEPSETTAATEPPETTVSTEPSETTVVTEPTETTAATEPKETTAVTEPESTEATEPEVISDAVQAFLDAVAAIVLPEEINEETGPVLNEQIGAAQEAYGALSEEELAREDVQAAAVKMQEAMNFLTGGLRTLETTYVAKIGENTYETLDEAIEAASNGDTITLLADAVATKTFYKSLTFTGGHTVSVDAYGWRYNGNLIIDGANFNINTDESSPVANNGEAGKWFTMVLGGSITAKNGANVTFTFDSTSGTNCAIYAGSGGVTINVENNSAFRIYGKNTKGVTGQGIQLDSTANTGIFVTGNSTFLIDGTNRGYVNSPTVYVEDSTFTVQNCTANASNGGKFTAINSQINFLNNTGHGLSATTLSIEKNSVVTCNGNGYYGVTVGSKVTMDGTSQLTANENGWGSTGGALRLASASTVGTFSAGAKVELNENVRNALENYGSCTFEDGVELTITNNSEPNNGAGIYNGSEGKLILPANAVVMYNEAGKTGGGICNKGDTTIPASVKLYNNHAGSAGDDIYNDETGTITFDKVGSGWALDGAPDCTDAIDGWYYDGYATDKDGIPIIFRWDAHSGKPYTVEYTDYGKAFTGKLALKAAHALNVDVPDLPVVTPDWKVSKSKTATNLDENFESKVTLSLPSAEQQLVSDVVFVLDKSTSAALESQALQMLKDLQTQIQNTSAKVNVGVVIFNKEAHVTNFMDLATQYSAIEEAIKQEISSGTNTHAGLLAGKAMLDADTSVSASRKYLIFVSDGITYMYNAVPTVTAWTFKADTVLNWAGPDNWNSKYKSNDAPESWKDYLVAVSKQVAAQGTLYEYPYGGTVTNATPVEKQSDYANSIDKALYLTYLAYQSIAQEGYHCYAVKADTGSGGQYTWGPSFMEFLAGGSTYSFETIKNDILYLVDKGSRVEDFIGYVDGDYDFDFVNDADSMELKIGDATYKAVKIGEDEYGFKQTSDGYAYTVTYVKGDGKGEEHFVWYINEPITNFAPVQLTYTVKLTNPKTTPGTYGIYDADGSKEYGSLYTNNSATLYPVDSNGKQGDSQDFPKPTVSYEVKKTDPEPTETDPTVPDPTDPEPDYGKLTIDKSANRTTVRPGKTITYTIKVTNKTGVDLEDIVVSEKLDGNLTFVSSSGDGSYSVNNGQWTISELKNGKTAKLTIKATVKSGVKDGTVIKNTVVITDVPGDPSDTVKVTVSNKISLIPETGDTSNIGLWIGVLVACAVVLGVVLILTVKKKKTR